MADSNLATRLRMIPPESTVSLSWTRAGDTVHGRGIIGSDNHPVGSRRLEAADRELLLTPTTDGVSVAKLTATGTEPLGTLTFLCPLEQPTETLRITDAGIDVPPALVGYTGRLTLQSHADKVYVRISEPGLRHYSRRLLAELHELHPVFVHERSLWIRPGGGPKREYELVDDRTHTQTAEPTTNQQRYDDLQQVSNTIQVLSKAVYKDDRLENRASDRIGRKLQALQSHLQAARELLFERPRRELPVRADDVAGYTWKAYTDALEWLDDRIDDIRQRIEADADLPLERRRPVIAQLSQLTELEAIRQTLAGQPTDAGGDEPAADDRQAITDNRPQSSLTDECPRQQNGGRTNDTEHSTRAECTVSVHPTTSDADGGVQNE